jgi:hypothetical protein
VLPSLSGKASPCQPLHAKTAGETSNTGRPTFHRAVYESAKPLLAPNADTAMITCDQDDILRMHKFNAPAFERNDKAQLTLS